MNSKSKIWQIVLLALLVLAIAAILLFNNKLNASKESLSSTIAQLNEEQANSAALQADLDAAKVDYEDVTNQLKQAQAAAEQLTTEVENGKAAAERLEGDLTAANGRVSELETSVDEKDKAIATLQSAAGEAEAKIAQLEDSATQTAARVSELESTAAKREEALKELEGTVAEKDEAIKGLEAAVAEKDEAIEALNDAVAAHAATIDALSEVVSEHEAKALNDQIEAMAARLSEAADRLSGQPVDEAVDVEAIKAEISALAGADSEEMTAVERLEALENIQVLLTSAAQTPEGGEEAAQTAAPAEKPDANGAEDTGADEANQTPEVTEGADGQSPAEDLPGDAGADEDALNALQAKLDEAEAEVGQLSAELEEKLSTIDDLNGQIEVLDARAETDASQMEALRAELAEAQSDAEGKIAALEDAQAAYAQRLQELEAYRLNRDITSGEAHISTSVDNAIEVASDGVTAAWQYANSNLSGNTAVLTLALDGEQIYASQPLKPGETVESLTLNAPLAPGSHPAMAVTTVYDENGQPQLTSRVPVTLNVADN